MVIEAALDDLTNLMDASRFGIKVFNANVVVHRSGDTVGWRTVFSIEPDKAAEAIEFLAWAINNDMMRARSMRADFIHWPNSVSARPLP